ncbi:MAG: hypothetical protein AB7L84_12840 [Acidimicrobiia bacterium]
MRLALGAAVLLVVVLASLVVGALSGPKDGTVEDVPPQAIAHAYCTTWVVPAEGAIVLVEAVDGASVKALVSSAGQSLGTWREFEDKGLAAVCTYVHAGVRSVVAVAPGFGPTVLERTRPSGRSTT